MSTITCQVPAKAEHTEALKTVGEVIEYFEALMSCFPEDECRDLQAAMRVLNGETSQTDPTTFGWDRNNLTIHWGN